MARIVLTGGPGSGKTTIAHALADELAGVTLVTEAATQVYTERGLRWDRIDIETRRDVQRAMYDLQLAQETAAEQDGARALLLDRGTVDGAAYWPDGPDAFWPDRGTTHAAELARYDAVILLETSAAVGAYDGDASNSVRFEGAAEAIASGRLLADLWKDHPHQHHVAATQAFDEKLAAVRALVTRCLEPSS